LRVFYLRYFIYVIQYMYRCWRRYREPNSLDR